MNLFMASMSDRKIDDSFKLVGFMLGAELQLSVPPRMKPKELK